MELRHRREALVGALIIAGTAIFLFLSLWLRGKTLRQLDQVKVVFDDVMGLKEGDPVRTSGVAVGQVRKISLRSAGNVDVWISIEHAPVPKTDAAAEIHNALRDRRVAGRSGGASGIRAVVAFRSGAAASSAQPGGAQSAQTTRWDQWKAAPFPKSSPVRRLEHL